MLPTEASRRRLLRIVREQADHIDWELLVERGRYLLILPLLRYNLARVDALTLLPPAFQEALREEAERWAARELGAVGEARRLLVLLQAHGIQALPLKGTALMLGRYYPQPGLRPALDIDLVVPPAEVEKADLLLAQHGFTPLPGQRTLRQRQRLPNERNHLWPRRSPRGMVIELHHRAFHFSDGERDFSYDQIWRAARSIDTSFLPLPAAGDLAFHLIHHTLVDLQSGHAILRTICDLFFLFRHDPQAYAQACQRGGEFGFPGAVYLAEQAVNHRASANLEALEVDTARPELALLLETALLNSHEQLAEAARLFEYFNFSRHPLQKAGNLLSLLFPRREQVTRSGNRPGSGPPRGALPGYLHRPIDLLRRIDWRSLGAANLRRLIDIRKAARRLPPRPTSGIEAGPDRTDR
ncbi:MAG: nucleotidyltransferase domain-containing protein [Blastocatellia bacterium]